MRDKNHRALVDWNDPVNEELIKCVIRGIGGPAMTRDLLGITKGVVSSFTSRRFREAYNLTPSRDAEALARQLMAMPRMHLTRPDGSAVPSVIYDGTGVPLTEEQLVAVINKVLDTAYHAIRNRPKRPREVAEALMLVSRTEPPSRSTQDEPEGRISAPTLAPTLSQVEGSDQENDSGMSEALMETMGVNNEWGKDEEKLRELKRLWPNALSILEAREGRCRFPLWDVKVTEDGGITSSGCWGRDSHRYVCGDPTGGRSYCGRCLTYVSSELRPRGVGMVRPRFLVRRNQAAQT